MTHRRVVGARGEALSAAWYGAAGYEVLARNWRCGEVAIDLVCSKSGTVVICEVKTRTSDRFGMPLDAVTAAKRRRLRRLAARWLREHGVGCRDVRFDVAAVRSGSGTVEIVTLTW